MSDQDAGSVTVESTRNGTVWKAISWVAAGAGILSVVMTLIQGGIALAGIPKGAFWTVLIAVTSPGILVAGLGLICGGIAWFSAYRQRAMIGMAGFAITFALFAIFSVVFG